MQVFEAREVLEVVDALGAERLGAAEDPVRSEGSADLREQLGRRLHGEVTDGAVPDDHVVPLPWKRVSDRIGQVVGDVRTGIHAACARDRGRIDVDPVHGSAARRQETGGEEAVAATDVEQRVSFADHLGREERPKPRVRPALRRAEREIERTDAMIEEVRWLVSPEPLAPEARRIVLPQRVEQQPLAETTSADRRLEHPGGTAEVAA